MVRSINVRNFGDENMDHLTNEIIDRFVKQINGKGIVSLIKNIHLNHNIRKHDNDKQLWKVFENGDYKTAICELIDKNKNILCQRLYNPEFEEGFKLLMMNYLKFDMNTLPMHFWQCARDTYAALVNFEVLPQIVNPTMP